MITHNEIERRFESAVGGGLAFLNYTIGDGTIVLSHTEVPDVAEGKGVGASLVRAALDFARESKRKVVPRCPFVASYMRRHPEYFDLLGEEDRAKLERE